MERRSMLVYSGKGSSHSWTWLADLFEKNGILDVRFEDTRGFTEQLTDNVEEVIISGGDGMAIASALGPHGFSHLKGYTHRGGKFIGICAGAYLPLPSSVEPFSRFNLSTTKIENIEAGLGQIEGISPRIAVKYGSCSIVHPVRGELELEHNGSLLRAPLYGGPVFKEPAADVVLVRYHGITDGSELQMDRTRAISMMSGKPAAIRSRHGLGELLLFGPHLEHPRYSEANRLFLELIGAKRENIGARREPQAEGNRFVERGIGDLKVAILGLENRSFLVGNKLWDGSRFLELVGAIESRYHTLDSSRTDEMTDLLIRVRAEILKAKPESLLYSDGGPELLIEAARLVVNNHFAVLRKSR